MLPRPWPIRFLIWLAICGISAAPSFYIAAVVLGVDDYLAMVAGILAWVILYTVASGTRLACRMQRSPRLRRTLRFGYYSRILITIIYPLGTWVDLWCGFPSVAVGQFLTGGDDTVAFTFVTTVVQGAVLNAGLAVYMFLIWCVQRVTGGREVVPRHMCRRCGYDLRATASGRCPECGLEVRGAEAPSVESTAA